MSRRRGEVVEKEVDRPKSYSPTASIQVAQQILNTASIGGTSNFCFFDTGADIDAKNNRQIFTFGTVVELKPGQFPNQTGNGTVDAESISEVWLPFTGSSGTKSVMRIKYVAYISENFLYNVSGERFYRKGVRLNNDELISPNGELLSL